ncbi:hypothetical protein H696_03054 [Fonticula alba]|uniref:RRM domain-containing protein n=1 Tax=Fonticula alba TaxID=691883 RepID=A0A058Z9B6_FONAL|nr:hypothetical protein H696_03054 [Fonticula alba]KCV70701.1 hypothetical protein H696_03054 [Fonticula alba]|eukprot:XP_009495217.1 hypothetical protein H696_03054 [Fonticula alba]
MSSSPFFGKGKFYGFPESAIPATPTPSAMLVTNIASEVKEKDLDDFFAFCGEISAIHVISWPPQSSEESNQDLPAVAGAGLNSRTKRAIILFKRPQAAKTAILLHQALINGRPVEITHLFTSEQLAASLVIDGSDSVAASDTDGFIEIDDSGSVMTTRASRIAKEYGSAGEEDLLLGPEDSIEDGPLRQEHKPKLSIMAELMDRGYKLTEKILQDAKAFDAKHGISAKFAYHLEQARALDREYEVGARADAAVEAARVSAATALAAAQDAVMAAAGAARQLDATYGLQQRAQAATDAIKESDAARAVADAFRAAQASEPARRAAAALEALQESEPARRLSASATAARNSEAGKAFEAAVLAAAAAFNAVGAAAYEAATGQKLHPSSAAAAVAAAHDLDSQHPEALDLLLNADDLAAARRWMNETDPDSPLVDAVEGPAVGAAAASPAAVGAVRDVSSSPELLVDAPAPGGKEQEFQA